MTVPRRPGTSYRFTKTSLPEEIGVTYVFVCVCVGSRFFERRMSFRVSPSRHGRFVPRKDER